MYVNWVKDTYGPDHYPQELEHLFGLLPEDAREALSELVRSHMVSRYEVFSSALYDRNLWTLSEVGDILRKYLYNTGKSENHIYQGANQFLDELTEDNAGTILCGSFNWDTTPEGANFWATIYGELKK